MKTSKKPHAQPHKYAVGKLVTLVEAYRPRGIDGPLLSTGVIVEQLRGAIGQPRYGIRLDEYYAGNQCDFSETELM